MVQAGITRLTSNLRDTIKELKSESQNVWKAAFMDVYRGNIQAARNILEQETVRAITATQEYRYPAFRDALLTAVRNDNILIFRPSSDFGKIVAIIRMDEVAGTLDEYAEAVEYAREVLKVGKGETNESDRIYWQSIYNAARTGGGSIATKGLSSRLENRLRELYHRTIAVRLSFIRQGTAPFWALVDQGNAGTMGGNASYAYPSVSPTNFVDKATRRIESLFNRTYSGKLRELNRRFVEESVDFRNLQSAVSRAVTGLDPGKLRPGSILAEVEVGSRQYNIYITNTQLVGLGLSSRVRGYTSG